MQISRLIARLTYEQMRSVKSEFISEKVIRTSDAHFQFFRLSYSSIDLEDYVGGLIAPPDLVIRQLDDKIERISLDSKVSLDLSPIARFCRGRSDNDGDYLPCTGANEDNPYGRLINFLRSEKCDECGKLQSYLVCLRGVPRYDGLKVVCGNKEFAGSVCNSVFGIYVTRYGDTLKVGTSLLHNILARLQEQGTSSALIIYPILNIARTHYLESGIKSILSNNFLNRDGISKVSLRAPNFEERVNEFLHSWSNSEDTDLYLQIEAFLSEREFILPEFGQVRLSNAKTKLVTLNTNYLKPPSRQYVPFSVIPRIKIKGEIVGYRGSTVFLDNGCVFDLRRLQGFVCTGNVFAN
jgi:hypothetical protein